MSRLIVKKEEASTVIGHKRAHNREELEAEEGRTDSSDSDTPLAKKIKSVANSGNS